MHKFSLVYYKITSTGGLTMTFPFVPHSCHGAHPGGHLHRVPRLHLLDFIHTKNPTPEAGEESQTVWRTCQVSFVISVVFVVTLSYHSSNISSCNSSSNSSILTILNTYKIDSFHY